MRHFSARETAWLQELDGIELASFNRRALAFLIDWSLVGITLSVVLSIGAVAFYGIARAIGHPVHVKNIDLENGSVKINNNDFKAADVADDDDSDDSGKATASASKAANSHIHVQTGFPKDAENDADMTTSHRVFKEITKVTSDVIVPVLYFGILLWRGKGQTPGKRWMKIRVVSIVHPHLSFWHSIERALGYGAAALEAGFGFFQFWIHPYRRCAQDRLAETIVVTESAYQTMLVTRGKVQN